MTLPNFIIIGAMKAGTTSMYQYLKAHPQIFMCPRKEPKFFAFEGGEPTYSGPMQTEFGKFAITTIDRYKALYRKATDEIAIGEASPLYMFSEKAPERIQHYIPDVKLIAILRHPADRAYSNFQHMIRNGDEPYGDFRRALAQEQWRVERNWHPRWYYTRRGYYHEQLKRYYDRFDRSQIRVYRYDDYTAEPMTVIRDIYRFLGVDDSVEPDMSQTYNTGRGVPKNLLLQQVYAFLAKPGILAKWPMARKLARKNRKMVQRWIARNLEYRPMPDDLRQELTELYREDILKTQELTGVDLSAWFKPKKKRSAEPTGEAVSAP